MTSTQTQINLKSEDSNNELTFSLFNRLERIDREITSLKKELVEDITKVTSDSKKNDELKEKNHSKEVSEIEAELNSRLTRIEETLKSSHNSHVDERRYLIMEFENQKNSNQAMIEECLRLLQKLEYLEMRVGKR